MDNFKKSVKNTVLNNDEIGNYKIKVYSMSL